jgi:hypothetical protein
MSLLHGSTSTCLSIHYLENQFGVAQELKQISAKQKQIQDITQIK